MRNVPKMCSHALARQQLFHRRIPGNSARDRDEKRSADVIIKVVLVIEVGNEEEEARALGFVDPQGPVPVHFDVFMNAGKAELNFSKDLEVSSVEHLKAELGPCDDGALVFVVDSRADTVCFVKHFSAGVQLQEPVLVGLFDMQRQQEAVGELGLLHETQLPGIAISVTKACFPPGLCLSALQHCHEVVAL